MRSGLPQADCMPAGRNSKADWFRDALKEKGIMACISGRKKAVRHGRCRYKRWYRLEIMFGRPKNWKRVATPYDWSLVLSPKPFCARLLGTIPGHSIWSPAAKGKIVLLASSVP